MKCLFIYNPNSGKKKIVKNVGKVVAFLEDIYESVDSYATKAPRDAYNHLCEIAQNYDIIVVSGGDGTLNECVSAIVTKEKDIIVGYLPTGTTNDIARTLRIPKNIDKALEIISKNYSAPYDLLKINDKYGIYVCCTGIYTSISYETPQKLKAVFGRIAYGLYILKTWFKQKAQKVSLKYDGGEYNGYVSCVFAINSRYLSGFKVNKNADLNDGRVDVVFCKTKGEKIRLCDKLRMFKFFIKGLKGIDKDKNFVKINTSHLSISGDNPIVINIDGEREFEGEAKLMVLKDKIKFIQNKERK